MENGSKPPTTILLDAQRSIFDKIQGVWIADETLSRVFDISSQSVYQLVECNKVSLLSIVASIHKQKRLKVCASSN